jgi:ankyrin repeat protein
MDVTRDVTRPNKKGWTPMLAACFNGFLEIVQWLHARGAAMDVTRPTKKGETPMFGACYNGHLEIVQWLHAHGAAMDVTRPDNNGVTPMLIACWNGHFEIVQWLHAHGAAMDVTRPCWQGKTPMDSACEKGHLNIVQHLIRHHKMPPDTLEQWHPRLSYSSKRQLHQAAHENLFDCQSFLTLATIVCYIKTEPYKVMNKKTGRLVVPKSSILIFRRQVAKRHLLWMIAGYICGGEETRHIWHLIRKKN